MKVSIGYDAYAEENEIDLILPPNSAPSKRKIDEADKDGMLYDATAGHKTRSIFTCKTGKIVLCALQTNTLAARLNRVNEKEAKKKSFS